VNRKLKNAGIIMVLTCLLVSAGAAYVLADNAVSGDGFQAIVKTPLTEKEVLQEKERSADADRIAELLEEAIDKDIILTKDSDFYLAAQEYAKKWKGDKSNIVLPQKTRSSTYGLLGVSKRGQEETYYCGPASAEQLLEYLGFYSNPEDGRSTTQDNLADDLNTTTSGTPFSGTWGSTLTDWTTGAIYSARWTPSSSTLWSKTVADVSTGWPLIYDVHMHNDVYLTGYSGSTWWHYVTGDGYQDFGTGYKEVHYVDPNRYRSAAYGPHWFSLATMTTLLDDRGYSLVNIKGVSCPLI